MASIGSLSLVSEAKAESSAILLHRGNGYSRRPRLPFFASLPRRGLQSNPFKGLSLRAIAKGSEGSESRDESEDALQATIEKSKKVLAMQRDLLQQIAERKKLITTIKSSTVDSGQDDDPEVEDENGSIVSSTYASATSEKEPEILASASSGGFGESESSYRKDLPKETVPPQVEPIKQWEDVVVANSSGASRGFSSTERKQGKELPKKTTMPHTKQSDTTFSKRIVASQASTETQSKPGKDVPKTKVPSQGNPNKQWKATSPEADWSDPLPSFLSSTSEVSTLKNDKKTKSGEPRIEVVEEEKEDSSDAEAKPPPLAGANVMNVIIVAAECAPWSKTGGLGDVAGALPKALARRGHRVMVVVPYYANYPEPKDSGVRKKYKVGDEECEVSYLQTFIDGVDFVFIDHHLFRHVGNNIYGGNRVEILRRMVLFCKAAVEVPWHVPCGGVCYGDGNLGFIANDWHTALLPVYLKAYYRDNGLMTYARSTLVIHNMAHQGRGPVDDFFFVDLPHHYIDLFKLYDPVGGDHFNIFAAGLKTADRIVTVSHGYAWEIKTSEGGWGLHRIINESDWKLRGIVNGIDTKEWNPECDVHLTTDGYTNYSLETLKTGKPKCKAALQKELGLPVREDVPLIGFIGRLDQQKGVDLIAEAIPWMMGQDVQLVMLGTGRPDLEQMLRDFENQHRDRVRGWVGFSVKTAHRITAGADILLMPSRFEPCGLNQLYAMMYGTVPVVHGVGGLRDTVQPFNPFEETGVGWTFDSADSSKLIHALGNCLYTYREYKKSWEGLQRRGMSQDLSWDKAAQNYEEVLVAAKYQW